MSTEYDAELERRIAEDQGVERERSAAQRRHRFAEVETLAKRLYGGVEYERFDPTALANRGEWVRAPAYQPRTIDAERAFDMECALFHALHPSTTNLIHPASPKGSGRPCFICHGCQESSNFIFRVSAMKSMSHP